MPSVRVFSGWSWDWRQFTNPVTGVHQAIYVNIDTSNLALPGTPYYSTSLDGTAGMPAWTVGATTVSNVSPTGFRVDVRRPNNAQLTVQEAKNGRWFIRYVGTLVVGGNPFLPQVVIGRGATRPTDWVQYNESGVYVDVDTRHARFPDTPTYVSALYGDAGHWETTGGSSIYSPTATSFRVYVRHPDGRPLSRQTAQDLGWYIGWIGEYIQPEPIIG